MRNNQIQSLSVKSRKKKSIREDLSDHMSQLSKKSNLKNKKTIVYNPNPVENPNFTFADLNTLENHWIKRKGVTIENKKVGKCQIFLYGGGEIYCNFTNDKANGKGYYKTNKKRIKATWIDNKL